MLIGLTLNAALGWWWADPLAALVIVYYALREARAPSTTRIPPIGQPARPRTGSAVSGREPGEAADQGQSLR